MSYTTIIVLVAIIATFATWFLNWFLSPERKSFIPFYIAVAVFNAVAFGLLIHLAPAQQDAENTRQVVTNLVQYQEQSK